MTSYNDNITDTVSRLAEPVLSEHDLELVEVQFRQEQIGWVLRLIIFKEGGITVGDCTRVSREINHLLDVEDVIEQKYTLEVSSPGLDRPLRSSSDFRRNKGEKVRIDIEDDGGRQRLTGIVEKVDSDVVTMKIDGDTRAFPLEKIKKAKLVIEF